MLQKFLDGVKTRLTAARTRRPAAFDWAVLITELLPVVLSLFQNCGKTSLASAMAGGHVGTLDRIRLIATIRRETDLRFGDAGLLADAMIAEAESQQATPTASPGRTWLDDVADEIQAV